MSLTSTPTITIFHTVRYLTLEFPDSWKDERLPYWFYTALCLAVLRGGFQSLSVWVLVNLMPRISSRHGTLSRSLRIVFNMYIVYVFRIVLKSLWAQLMEIFVNGVRPDKVYTICIGSSNCYDFHL